MYRTLRYPASRLVSSAPRRSTVRALTALVAVASAPALQAQTLVPNPQLDTQLAPFQTFVSAAPDPTGTGAAPTWQSPPDVNASAASGSALVHLSPSATNAKSGIAQCFDFSAPTSVNFVNYSIAFRAADAAVLDGTVSATAEIRLYAGAGCSGFLSGGTQAQTLIAPAVPVATWYRVSDSNFVPNNAPVMAASAEIRGYLRQTGAAPTQPSYAVNFDHFVLVLNSTTPVQLIHFDVD
jgi:hypothetical protein